MGSSAEPTVSWEDDVMPELYTPSETLDIARSVCIIDIAALESFSDIDLSECGDSEDHAIALVTHSIWFLWGTGQMPDVYSPSSPPKEVD